MASGGHVEKRVIALSEEDISKFKINCFIDAYERIGIQKPMKKDRLRIEAYRDTILNNRHLFKGRIVLDVGCGTGIMSVIAADAGATQVIGVDVSDIIKHARNIIRDNGFEGVITLIQGKIEEVELPDGIDQVDIIISDWMRGSLFYEGMLDSVLFARNKWLKHDGLMFPNKVKLFLVGLEDIQLKVHRVDFWDNVEGCNMSVLGRFARRQPFMVDVDLKQIVTNVSQLVELDLKTLKKEDANLSVPFSLSVTQQHYLNAFGTFLEVEFSATYTGVKLSTSPNGPAAHWKQTVFLTDEIIRVDVGEMIEGQFDLRQNPRHKINLDIAIKVDFDGKNSKMHENNVYMMR